MMLLQFCCAMTYIDVIIMVYVICICNGMVWCGVWDSTSNASRRGVKLARGKASAVSLTGYITSAINPKYHNQTILSQINPIFFFYSCRGDTQYHVVTLHGKHTGLLKHYMTV